MRFSIRLVSAALLQAGSRRRELLDARACQAKAKFRHLVARRREATLPEAERWDVQVGPAQAKFLEALHPVRWGVPGVPEQARCLPVDSHPERSGAREPQDLARFLGVLRLGRSDEREPQGRARHLGVDHLEQLDELDILDRARSPAVDLWAAG
jgi:hypothetical protein